MEPLNQSVRRTPSKVAAAVTTFAAILLLCSTYFFHQTSFIEQAYYRKCIKNADSLRQADSLVQRDLAQHFQMCEVQLTNMDSIYNKMPKTDTLKLASWASYLQDAGARLSLKLAGFNEAIHKKTVPSSQKQMYLYLAHLMAAQKANYLLLAGLEPKAESATRLEAQLSESTREKQMIEGNLQTARSETLEEKKQAIGTGNEKWATEGLLSIQAFKNEQLTQRNEQLTKEIVHLQHDLLQHRDNTEELKTTLKNLTKQARQDLRDAQDPKRKNRPGTGNLMEGWLNRLDHFLLLP